MATFKRVDLLDGPRDSDTKTRRVVVIVPREKRYLPRDILVSDSRRRSGADKSRNEPPTIRRKTVTIRIILFERANDSEGRN